jgi:hypothetical protein
MEQMAITGAATQLLTDSAAGLCEAIPRQVDMCNETTGIGD